MSAADGAPALVVESEETETRRHLPVVGPKRRRGPQEMTGVRSGKLTVVARQGRAISGGAAWLCRCDCGAEVVVPGSKLRGPDPQQSCKPCFYASLRKTDKAPRGSRRRAGVRPVTILMRRFPKKEMERLRLMYPESDAALYQRPVTRGDCAGSEGPCPWVSCKFNLYLDVNTRNGNIKLNFPDREVWEVPELCALHIADRGETTVEDIGALTNLTRERIRQVEDAALAAMKASSPHMAAHLDESSDRVVTYSKHRTRGMWDYAAALGAAR